MLGVLYVFMPGVATGTTTSGGTTLRILGDGQLQPLTSSIRFKDEISDIEVDSNKVFDLRPVSFTYKSNLTDNDIANDDERDFGFIAEEVDEVLPEMVVYDSENLPYSVKYDQLAVLLLMELKKLKNENDENSKLISELMERLEKLEPRNKKGRSKPHDKQRDDKDESESLGGGL